MTPNRPLPQNLMRENLQRKYNLARSNLILVTAFTAINILLLIFTYGETYFLFSASVPYYLVLYGMLYAGRFPAEFYGEELAAWQELFLGDGFFFALLFAAILVVLVYLALYFLSGKGRMPFLIGALVLISVDTVAMFLFSLDPSMILDVLFHIWVIVSLVQGIRAGIALSKLPPEIPMPEAEAPPSYFETKL